MISWVHLKKALTQKWTTNLYNLRKKVAGTLPLADPLEILWQDFHTWQSLWNFSSLKVISFNFVYLKSRAFWSLLSSGNESEFFLGLPSWCALGIHNLTNEQPPYNMVTQEGNRDLFDWIGEDWLVQFKQCGGQRHEGHAFLLSYQPIYQFPVQLYSFA